MEVIKGTAAGVRSTIHVSGDKNGISTRHHTIFKVGVATVMFTSGAPAIIGEGDQLTVAGKMKGRRILIAHAYLNQTAGVRGDAGMWANFIGMVFIGMVFSFLLAAAGLCWVLLGPVIPGIPHLDAELKWLVAVAGAVFCGFWLCCLYRWLRIREAVKLVRGDSKASRLVTPFRHQ